MIAVELSSSVLIFCRGLVKQYAVVFWQETFINIESKIMKNIAVKENHLYKKAYTGGKKAFGRYTVIYVLKDLKAFRLKKENPQKRFVNRIGLTVTKKLGNAVTRNRVKRIVRAAFAQTEKEFCLKKGNIIIIAAREAATAARSVDIYSEMKDQFKKLGMISAREEQ